MGGIEDRIRSLREKQIITEISLDEKKNDEIPGFPVHVFPYDYQEIVNKVSEVRGISKDYLAFSVLCACSSQIGLSYRLRMPNGMESTATIFGAVVGASATGKSPAVKFATFPILEREKQAYRNYKEDRIRYQAEVMQDKKNAASLIPPKRTQYFLNDSTFEKIIGIMEENPKGLLMVHDELIGWLRSFNRYRAGSDSQNWLSVWSNGFAITNRVGRDGELIDETFVTVFGGIQKKTLNALAEKSYASDGLLYRFLFTFFQGNYKPMSFDTFMSQLPFWVTENYRKYLNRLTDIKYDEPRYLPLEGKELKLFADWFEKNEKKIAEAANEENDALCSIYSKMSIYCTRLALILEMMNYSTGAGIEKISEKSMLGAIELVTYFEKTMMIALNVIEQSNEEDRVERMAERMVSTGIDWDNILEIGEIKKRSEIVADLMSYYKISQRTADTYLKRDLKKTERYGYFTR